jgi:two-component sensor histidine kinase
LVTKALKHSLYKTDDGVIWVDLARAAAGGLQLAVRDNGGAKPPMPVCRTVMLSALPGGLR